MKKILVIMSSAPFGGIKAREGQDMLMALAAVEHSVSVLYCGAGVLQLRQQGTKLPVKDFTVQQKLFELYDIAQVFACRNSMMAWQLDPKDLKIDVNLIDTNEFSVSDFDFVVEM